MVAAPEAATPVRKTSVIRTSSTSKKSPEGTRRRHDVGRSEHLRPRAAQKIYSDPPYHPLPPGRTLCQEVKWETPTTEYRTGRPPIGARPVLLSGYEYIKSVTLFLPTRQSSPMIPLRYSRRTTLPNLGSLDFVMYEALSPAQFYFIILETDYCLRRRNSTRPPRPAPRRRNVEGSGTVSVVRSI